MNQVLCNPNKAIAHAIAQVQADPDARVQFDAITAELLAFGYGFGLSNKLAARGVLNARGLLERLDEQAQAELVSEIVFELGFEP